MLEDGVYLMSHSLGPQPRAVRESMGDYLGRWQASLAKNAWKYDWWPLARRAGDLVARILGAPPGTVEMQPSATVAVAVVASCFDFARGPRRKVVTTALDFPSMGYVWDAQRRLGAEVLVVPSDDGVHVSMDRLLAAIDEETCLVAVSHVSYRSSFRVDAAALVAAAHEKGAHVLLDVYQSAGAMPLDAARLGVDFLVGGTIKWLCGGPASGYLYVRRDLIERLEPRLTGWIAHAEPFDFLYDAMEYDDSIRRFAHGTPNVPGLYSALPGLEILAQLDHGEVRAESLRRTDWMVEQARERGWRLTCPLAGERRGGAVMIDLPEPKRLVAELERRRIAVDERPGVGLRISPHFFNTDAEVAEALEALAELV
jgi:kynureninase